MIKHNCNKARTKRYDYQCFTYEKEMGIIKFQLCPSSKISFGELLENQQVHFFGRKGYCSHYMIITAIMSEKCEKILKLK